MTDIKQAIVLRSNIGMSPGKACGQAAHASIMACMQAKPSDIMEWISKYNQTKIVLAVRSEECLFDIEKNCSKKDIPCAIVHDAGKTELEPGTVTAIGVGPGPAFMIDSITGNLPLYKGDEEFNLKMKEENKMNEHIGEFRQTVYILAKAVGNDELAHEVLILPTKDLIDFVKSRFIKEVN